MVCAVMLVCRLCRVVHVVSFTFNENVSAEIAAVTRITFEGALTSVFLHVCLIMRKAFMYWKVGKVCWIVDWSVAELSMCPCSH